MAAPREVVFDVIDKPGQFVDNPDPGDILPPTFFRAPNTPSLDYNRPAAP
jgi:hypothetical protein